jgi:hypothetical protein
MNTELDGERIPMIVNFNKNLKKLGKPTMEYNDVFPDVVVDLLRDVDVNSFYEGKRMYVHFLENILMCSRYMANYIQNENFVKIVTYFYMNIPDRRDILPIILPFRFLDFVCCEDVFQTFTQSTALLIIMLIFIDEHFYEFLTEYIPFFEELEPTYWEYLEDDKNGYLKSIKYIIDEYFSF